jgi:hypothetical protein
MRWQRVSPVLVQVRQGVSPVLVQMWQGVSPVLVQVRAAGTRCKASREAQQQQQRDGDGVRAARVSAEGAEGTGSAEDTEGCGLRRALWVLRVPREPLRVL